jgi:cyclopropane-fatty-acyl-phospholipid synthase
VAEVLTGTQREQTAEPSRRAWPGWLRRWAVERLDLDKLGIDFVLPGGTRLASANGRPLATVRVLHAVDLFRMLWDPEDTFAEGYTTGRIEVDGDLERLLERIYTVSRNRPSPEWYTAQGLLEGTRGRARASVRRHYDLGNDFYARWLDRDMVYTCAYFPRADVTLEQAQVAKLDLVCRKLRLTPGETVYEAGCGWGALALHMARNYGVTVRAFNISHEQILFARERAAREGISNVEFVEDDYRAITGHCDAFVSVGMLEHVGTRHYESLGQVIDRTLGPDGRGLLHFIGRNQPRQLNRWIRRHIFPDAYAPTLDEVCAGVLQPANFSVLDVENLRLHYALTLRHWRERFEQHEPAVREQYGAEFVRMWRMYLAGSEASFVTGSVQLFQILFARGETNRVHWTRDWLTGGASA